MSVTVSEARAEVRSVIEAGGLAYPRRYHGDPTDSDGKVSLPDTPVTFAFIVFKNDGSGSGPTAFGGGRGSNLYRNQATVEAWVFAPNGEGLDVATDAAEQLAALLRSYRSSVISCSSADVIPVGEGSKLAPPGLVSEVNQYQCAVAEIALHFDQIG